MDDELNSETNRMQIEIQKYESEMNHMKTEIE